MAAAAVAYPVLSEALLLSAAAGVFVGYFFDADKRNAPQIYFDREKDAKYYNQIRAATPHDRVSRAPRLRQWHAGHTTHDAAFGGIHAYTQKHYAPNKQQRPGDSVVLRAAQGKGGALSAERLAGLRYAAQRAPDESFTRQLLQQAITVPKQRTYGHRRRK